MSGWIADHRKELESSIWLMPPMYHRVWQWLKYSVNHKPVKIPNRNGGFTTIQPGQRATSYRQIAKGVGYYEGLKWKEPNPKTIKAILEFMESNQMITVEGNSNGTVVTIANWVSYQEKVDKGNAKETLKKHSMDTNNNDNNDKQEKDYVAEVAKYYSDNCKSLPQAAKMTDKRKKEINARITDYGFEKVISVLDKAEQSDFLVKGAGNWFKYDWVFNPNNFIKILEGNYDNKQDKPVDRISEIMRKKEQGW